MISGDSKDMRTILECLTDESHFVREGEPRRVHLTALGWFVAIGLGTVIGLIGVGLAIWSMK
jgi:hypothetical protein